jgi:hypothetical protein
MTTQDSNATMAVVFDLENIAVKHQSLTRQIQIQTSAAKNANAE